MFGFAANQPLAGGGGGGGGVTALPLLLLLLLLLLQPPPLDCLPPDFFLPRAFALGRPHPPATISISSIVRIRMFFL